jgi:hypothetical protein
MTVSDTNRTPEPNDRSAVLVLFRAFEDPAAAIALAVRFARRARRQDAPMPKPILSLLDAHAEKGDPTCRDVLAWLVRSGLAAIGTRDGQVEHCPKPDEAGPASTKRMK